MGNETSQHRTSGQLRNKELAVIKSNSDLSEQEIQALYDEFKHECPSGRMNKNQFHKFYKKVAGPDDKYGQLSDNAFNVFDNNRDGTIDFSEFALACAVGSKQDLDSQLDLVFEMMDTSRDGSVNYDEMVKFMEIGLKMGDTRETKGMDSTTVATDMFNLFNLNKGQKLNKRQFIDGCKKNQHLMRMFGPS
ncbi:unnamed protein product [Rotaria sordida]|uniref:EF-hand domain-containing protein n=1 Tax=Rotaria sordida TaxID=392033 RepID=A0A815B2A2_9BILA|nr:unnamed protein product [Rotaria sordida]CAF1481659.1 unnamed protein product [Rotaria sordida]